MADTEDLIKTLFRRYDQIEYLTDTLYLVWKGNKWGVFSTEKEDTIVPIEYDSIEYLTDTLYLVWKNGKRGLLDISSGEIKWK